MEKDRSTLMAEYIINRGSASIEELSQHFNISVVTVRRDLKKLENRGIVEKYYGGVKPALENMNAFELRQKDNLDKKAYISALASNQICENDIIFIDSGTTVSKLLDTVDQFMRLTIFTNNLYIINKAVTMPNVDLIIIGDYYSRISNSFIHRVNIQNLNYKNLNLDKAFISASGLTIDKGLTNRNPLEQEIKVNMCKISEEIYALIDSSKFDQSYLLTILNLDRLDKVITDKKPAETYVNFFNENNIELIY